MAVTVSDTLVVVVVAVTVLTKSARAGYFYPRPNVAFELPKKLPNFQAGFHQKIISENVNHDTRESVVSYSLPFDDYNFLYQQKTGLPLSANLAANKLTPYNKYNVPTVGTNPIASAAVLEGPVNSIVSGEISVGNTPTVNIPTVDHTLNVPAVKTYQSNTAVNSLEHVSNPAVNKPFLNINTLIEHENDLSVRTDEHTNIPNTNIKSGFELITQHSNLAGNTFPVTSNSVDNIPIVSSPLSINQHRILESDTVYNNVQAVNLPIVDLPLPIHEQNNLRYTEPQINIGTAVSSNLDGSTGIQNAVSPKITKDIYFHVPPPEIEEPVVKTTTPIKKIYKIIFIKVPSQETQLPLSLRGEPFNQVAPIEDKTIIYVLSKKIEPQQVLSPKGVPSEHEVLFVKYSGNPATAAAPINGDLQLPGTELLPTSSLQAGFVNGKR